MCKDRPCVRERASWGTGAGGCFRGSSWLQCVACVQSCESNWEMSWGLAGPCIWGILSVLKSYVKLGRKGLGAPRYSSVGKSWGQGKTVGTWLMGRSPQHPRMSEQGPEPWWRPSGWTDRFNRTWWLLNVDANVNVEGQQGARIFLFRDFGNWEDSRIVLRIEIHEEGGANLFWGSGGRLL